MQTRRQILAAGAAVVLSRRAFAANGDLTSLTLKQAADKVRARQASPVELTEACLRRIEKYNPILNAYITVNTEQALAAAREREGEQQKGKWRGPLHGVPIALKDNIDTAGVRTTGASELFRDRIPSEDSEVARRLKDAGAILLGKLNLHEFAYGGTSLVTAFGGVHNPWALDHIAGGSSGGPAAAIAADLCFGSLGTDTAGSIRMPSSFCGIAGLKPTYGRVSNRGVIMLSWSMDHTGPMCKTVEDVALMLGAIAGYDDREPTSADVPVADYVRALKTPLAKLRLGLPRTPFFEGLNPEVASAVEAAIGVLRKLTAGSSDVQLPQWVNPASVWGPEIYAYHQKWVTESPERYQEQTRRAILASADIKAGAYAQARRELDVNRREIRKAFSNVDALITPTMLTPALTIAMPNGASARNTSPFDVFGIPTISIPCGFSSAGLPIGMQISAAPWAEATVLALAHAYEQATEWHKRRPKLPA